MKKFPLRSWSQISEAQSPPSRRNNVYLLLREFRSRKLLFQILLQVTPPEAHRRYFRRVPSTGAATGAPRTARGYRLELRQRREGPPRDLVLCAGGLVNRWIHDAFPSSWPGITLLALGNILVGSQDSDDMGLYIISTFFQSLLTLSEAYVPLGGCHRDF